MLETGKKYLLRSLDGPITAHFTVQESNVAEVDNFICKGILEFEFGLEHQQHPSLRNIDDTGFRGICQFLGTILGDDKSVYLWELAPDSADHCYVELFFKSSKAEKWYVPNRLATIVGITDVYPRYAKNLDVVEVLGDKIIPAGH